MHESLKKKREKKGPPKEKMKNQMVTKAKIRGEEEKKNPSLSLHAIFSF